MACATEKTSGKNAAAVAKPKANTSKISGSVPTNKTSDGKKK